MAPQELNSSRENKTADHKFGDCPKCGSPLSLKFKGKSHFLGCTAYPKCSYSQSIQKNDITEVKLIENSQCPKCSANLAVKNGRFGMFIGCTNFPECNFIVNKQDQAEKTSDYETVTCPECKTGIIQKKQSKFGKAFYACNNYPSCRYVLNQEPIEYDCENCYFPLALRYHDKLVCANRKCQKITTLPNS